MPTYAYRCTACMNSFDIQQAFSDSSLTVCPACGGPLRKVFGSIGVSFTGSGFYRTDSRATVGAGSGASDSGSGSTPTSGSGSESGASGTTGDSTPPSPSGGAAPKSGSAVTPAPASASGNSS